MNAHGSCAPGPRAAPLLERVLLELDPGGSGAAANVAADLGCFGYTLVGSSAYLRPPATTGTDGDVAGDVDAVLLSHREVEPEVALPRLGDALRGSPRLADAAIWYVQAVACLLKVVASDGIESVDLLFGGACEPLPPSPPPSVDLDQTSTTDGGASPRSPRLGVNDVDEAPAGDLGVDDVDEAPAGDLGAADGCRLRCLTPAQALGVLPATGGSRARDSVRLTDTVLGALDRPGSTFRTDHLTLLRQWAKGRHVYGGRYGFPGGSAWMVMFMVYCRWYDAELLDPGATGRAAPDVLWHFLLTLALWPWPLPFTVANLSTTAQGGALLAQQAARWDGGQVLEGSVGRRLATSFVVPLPCGTVWNMTQAVQPRGQQVRPSGGGGGEG